MPSHQHPIHGCKDPLALATLQMLIYDQTNLRHEAADRLAYIILRATNPKLFEPARVKQAEAPQ